MQDIGGAGERLRREQSKEVAVKEKSEVSNAKKNVRNEQTNIKVFASTVRPKIVKMSTPTKSRPPRPPLVLWDKKPSMSTPAKSRPPRPPLVPWDKKPSTKKKKQAGFAEPHSILTIGWAGVGFGWVWVGLELR